MKWLIDGKWTQERIFNIIFYLPVNSITRWHSFMSYTCALLQKKIQATNQILTNAIQFLNSFLAITD